MLQENFRKIGIPVKFSFHGKEKEENWISRIATKTFKGGNYMKQGINEFLNLLKLTAGQTGSNTVGDFVKSFLESHEISYTEDDFGNIYNISKKGIPLFVAHMDTVRSNDGVCPPIVINGGRISSPNFVLGGDDLNGVFLLINLLLDEEVNFMFTMDEETVYKASSKFFIIKKENFDLIRDNIPYFVVLDRKGNNDLLIEGAYNRYGSEFFEKKIGEFGIMYGYKIGRGIMCDADYLQVTGVSGCNISVGYYNAHMQNEYIEWNDILKAYRFIQSLVQDFNFSEPLKEVIVSKKKLKKSNKKKASKSVI
jgi:acetylornithine deacetylase/succinyl-diaminopimelate desuccinylase-like protein